VVSHFGNAGAMISNLYLYICNVLHNLLLWLVFIRMQPHTDIMLVSQWQLLERSLLVSHLQCAVSY
jgi:hypothetical protein